MSGRRVLLTNAALAGRGGTELYVRDVAGELLARGWDPVVYSPRLGEVAEEISATGVPVVASLEGVAPPDVIHGQHHGPTMIALLHFPGVPAVAFCHGAKPLYERVFAHPRVHRYVAVDGPCRERILAEVPGAGDRTRLVPNFADMRRFAPRDPLPERPKRALILANNVSERDLAPVARRACAGLGIELEGAGMSLARPLRTPETALPRFDLVLARGRSAIEAMAVGCAVVLCSETGVGPLVTSSAFDELRSRNFGFRTITEPLDAGLLRRQIERYDAADAARVQARIRAEASLDGAVDVLTAIYDEAIAEQRRAPATPELEARDVAAYLVTILRDVETHWASHVRLEAILASRTWRLKTALLDRPAVDRARRWLAGRGWRL